MFCLFFSPSSIVLFICPLFSSVRFSSVIFLQVTFKFVPFLTILLNHQIICKWWFLWFLSEFLVNKIKMNIISISHNMNSICPSFRGELNETGNGKSFPNFSDIQLISLNLLIDFSEYFHLHESQKSIFLYYFNILHEKPRKWKKYFW